MIDTLLLHAFALAALGGAAAMLLARHPMRVALALVLTMLSLAGVYAMLGMHAIAVFQVLIYVGAVMVFMVYVIMLLDPTDRSLRERFSAWLLPGGAALVLLIAAFAYAMQRGGPVAIGESSAGFGVKPFSMAFLADYWVHFELVSVLLVAVAVAAVAVVGAGRRSRG
jgi:NADH-quinone oxidoreductase subunit J